MSEVQGLRKAVPCPRCGTPSKREAWPFCSKRCAEIDLGRWFDGTYAVEVVEEDAGHGMDESEES